MGHTDRLRGLRHRRRRAARPRRRPSGDHQARRPPGAVGFDARRDPAGHRRRALPRGVRPRPRGRPRRQGRQRVQGQDRPARGLAARHRRRRRHDGGRVGHALDRRRGPPHTAQRAHRGRRADRLHVGLPALAQGGSGAERQRPAAELHAPADGPDDQHVRHRRRQRSRRHHQRAPSRASTSPSSAAARSTRPAATSCSG